MNVGILTYHWVSNFGANLQTLSTYKYVEKSGHKPIIINWVPDDVKAFYEKSVMPEQNDAHKNFGLRWFENITKACRNSEEIAKEIDANKIDLVLIGSDAVFSMTPWLARFAICRKGIVYNKPLSNFSFPSPFFGDFVNYVTRKIKIVAISASAQNTPYKKLIFSKEKKDMFSSFQNFSLISVRDIWTQKMLSHISNGRLMPDITPDPVFGFNNNVQSIIRDYVKDTLGIDGKYVLLSVSSTIRDTKWVQEIESLFAKENIKVVGMPKTLYKNYKSPLRYNLSFPMDPLDWYSSIAKSSGYIGELMHPVLVSLHNAVPVYSFDTYGFKRKGTLDKTSSKTFQIMKIFELEDYYYNSLLNNVPTPTEVYNKIMSFDDNRCRHIANVLYQKYDLMMRKSLSV